MQQFMSNRNNSIIFLKTFKKETYEEIKANINEHHYLLRDIKNLNDIEHQEISLKRSDIKSYYSKRLNNKLTKS